MDIDNTICTQEGTNYPSAKPWLNRIAKINELYDQGHRITYYTARNKRWESLTKLQLEQWGAKYDCLSVGEKPIFTYIIDDRAINSDIFFKDCNE